MKNLLLFLIGLSLSGMTSNDVIDKTTTNFDSNEALFQNHPNSIADLIDYWKDRYKGAGLETFTFEQETIRFKNGQATDTSIWYEAVEYPDHFRIDLGDKEDKNINLFRNDSIYVVRKGEVVRQGKEIQTSILMEGALYELPTDSTLAKLEFCKINTTVLGTGTYKGRSAYIIGAKDGDNTSPQIWMDVERRCVLRKISKTRKGSILEARYDDFINLGDYWIESWIEFFVDGKLVQTERYKNIKANPDLKAEVFDPNVFQGYYWY